MSKKLMFMTYDNSDGIHSIIARYNKSIRYFENYNELLNYFKNEHDLLHRQQARNNFNLIPYAYDNRLNKQVMMLVADYCGYKQQFISYVVIIDDYTDDKKLSVFKESINGSYEEELKKVKDIRDASRKWIKDVQVIKIDNEKDIVVFKHDAVVSQSYLKECADNFSKILGCKVLIIPKFWDITTVIKNNIISQKD